MRWLVLVCVVMHLDVYNRASWLKARPPSPTQLTFQGLDVSNRGDAQHGAVEDDSASDAHDDAKHFHGDLSHYGVLLGG